MNNFILKHSSMAGIVIARGENVPDETKNEFPSSPLFPGNGNINVNTHL